jgi:HD-like signal output (HDOD) protein
MFGWDHADAAALLAKRWNLPETFVALIGHHTQLEQLLAAGDDQKGNACVAVASLLPTCSDEEWDEQEQFVDAFDRLTSWDAEQLEELFRSVDEATVDFAPLLKLPVPARSLRDYLGESG